MEGLREASPHGLARPGLGPSRSDRSPPGGRLPLAEASIGACLRYAAAVIVRTLPTRPATIVGRPHIVSRRAPTYEYVWSGRRRTYGWRPIVGCFAAIGDNDVPRQTRPCAGRPAGA